MKYLKLFANHSDYNTAKSSLDKPNVSHCIQEHEVHYNPWTWAEEYLTFVAKEDGTFQLSTNAVSYSLDNGLTWTNLSSNTASPTVTAGNKIMWKAQLTPTNNDGIGTFSSTAEFDVQGNVMSLLYGDNYKGQTNLTGKNYAFRKLFYGNTKLKDVSKMSLPATTLSSNCYRATFSGCTNLISAPELPATTLTEYCYNNMFYNCTSLTKAPELPATTLAQWCYESMFYGCTSLTKAPELPATTLVNRCYGNMFYGCTSLVNAPELPAATLAEYCYYNMFYGCTSLIKAPELSATTLAENCYSQMFRDCTSLVNAPELPATILVRHCYNIMFSGCTSLTKAPELPATTLTYSCYGGMFQGCTSLTIAPELPATTLAEYCYASMFHSCTSLVNAPELPATTLVSNCYSTMFRGCNRLNYIKAMFTTTPSTSYTGDWVYGVASSGTFVKNSAAQWSVTGVNGIPTNWTVQTASE